VDYYNFHVILQESTTKSATILKHKPWPKSKINTL